MVFAASSVGGERQPSQQLSKCNDGPCTSETNSGTPMGTQSMVVLSFNCEHKAMCVQDKNLKCQVAVMLLGCLECQLSTVLRLKPRNRAESLALGS